MRSLKADAPRISRHTHVSERPAASTAHRSGGIVPPSRHSRPGDSFEKPGSKGPLSGRSGSSFETGGVRGTKTPGSATGIGAKKKTLSADQLATIDKAGKDLAARLGSNAKPRTVRSAALAIIKGLNLGSRILNHQAYHSLMASYRCASGSGAAGTRTFGAE